MKVQVWYCTSLSETIMYGRTKADNQPAPMRGMLELGTRGVSLEGHDYCLAWEGDLDIDSAPDLYGAAEKVWRAFNVVDGTEKPMKLGIRSMSTGDVVRLGTDAMNYALVARGFGFELTGDWPK